MKAAAGQLLHGPRRVVRSVAAGAVLVAVTFAGGVAIGLGGGNDSEGRNPKDRPGAPVDVPAPPIDSDDAGRDGNRPSESREAAQPQAAPGEAAAAAPRQNGRQGEDPARGSRPIKQTDQVAVTDRVLAPGAYDTDSGEAPARTKVKPGPKKGASIEADVGPSDLVDQDVPGAPTGGPDGPDDPPNDSDG